jgi:hypothetical protein
MNKIFYLIILLVQAVLFSQNIDKTSNENDTLENFLKRKELKIDSLKKIDFMNMKYKFLDSDFNIRIEKNEFKKVISNEYVELMNYNDSLMTILQHELGDNDAVNIAFHRILFSWKKLGYYIWEDEITAKEVAKSFCFDHPYLFLKYLKNENIVNSKKTRFLNELKFKMKEENIETNDTILYHALLKQAFRKNPERIKEKDEYLKRIIRN